MATPCRSPCHADLGVVLSITTLCPPCLYSSYRNISPHAAVRPILGKVEIPQVGARIGKKWRRPLQIVVMHFVVWFMQILHEPKCLIAGNERYSSALEVM